MGGGSRCRIRLRGGGGRVVRGRGGDFEVEGLDGGCMQWMGVKGRHLSVWRFGLGLIEDWVSVYSLGSMVN